MNQTIAKVIAMLALGFGSFFTGMLPACFSEASRQRHPLFISCLLCFGAGVLLSTSLTHMLPEAREKFPGYSELMLCVGFFLVYIVDEIVHFFYGGGAGHHHGPRRNFGVSGETGDASRRSYGSGEQTRLLQAPPPSGDGEMCCGDAGNPRMCHVSHTEPCNKSSSGFIGLLCALFVHSFLEGLAIGLQESASQVLLLLAAVASHKYVVGFCLGAEICASYARGWVHIMSVGLFAGGSAAGIGAGAALESVHSVEDSLAVPILQALAAGTLLYVTVSEVLPRERARWHERARAAGLAQLTAVSVGFTLMYLTSKFLDFDGA